MCICVERYTHWTDFEIFWFNSRAMYTLWSFLIANDSRFTNHCIDCKIEQWSSWISTLSKCWRQIFPFFDKKDQFMQRKEYACVRNEFKLFMLRKWLALGFLLERTIVCKMVSTLSPCNQLLSFSQSLHKYFSLCIHIHYFPIRFLYFQKSIRWKCANVCGIHLFIFFPHKSCRYTSLEHSHHFLDTYFFMLLLTLPILVRFPLRIKRHHNPTVWNYYFYCSLIVSRQLSQCLLFISMKTEMYTQMKQ